MLMTIKGRLKTTRLARVTCQSVHKAQGAYLKKIVENSESHHFINDINSKSLLYKKINPFLTG